MRDVTSTPPPDLAGALESFEQDFTYPLGFSARFRISHQPDYLRFFQAIGPAHLLLAMKESAVTGALVTAARSLHRDGEEIPSHYFCDLKILPSARGSRVLAALFAATQPRIRASISTACYGIVMGGTRQLPDSYTGRLEIPLFPKLADIAILRLSGEGELSSEIEEVPLKEFRESLRSRIRPGYTATGGDSKRRSSIAPIPLVLRDGSACGLLEDTRLAKRLMIDGGGELISAHLSGFAWENAASAALLLRHALALASARQLPALFVSVPDRLSAELLDQLQGMEVTVAPAAVYGHDLEPGQDWWVDTAEI